MSLFSRIAEKLASESGELKQIRVESERRRSAKSSASLPAVQAGQPVEQTVSLLAARIAYEKKSRDKPRKPGDLREGPI